MLTYLQRIEWFIGLVLLQVLVLNHMHINGYATPFFFIYFILKYNSGVSRNVLMIWAFLLGLAVDIFGNTPGMNAAAATVLAFMREPILRLVTLRDSVEDLNQVSKVWDSRLSSGISYYVLSYFVPFYLS